MLAYFHMLADQHVPCLGARFRMPFGAWTEEDWRLRDRRQPGPYLIHDEASTPSDVLLQAKAEEIETAVNIVAAGEKGARRGW
eukprot:s1997_g17.t1